MSRLVLDAGALIAAERGDRAVRATLDLSIVEELPLLTHAGIVGQVWRSPARQVRLSRILGAVAVWPIDQPLARSAGLLLAATGLSDVLGAALVAMTRAGDRILTSDPDDISRLAEAAGLLDVVVAAV